MNRLGKCIIAGVFAVSCLIYLIAVLFHKDWPPIVDAEQLKSECRILFLSNNGRTREVPIEEWPDSIKALTPRGVSIDYGFVEILISSGGIGPSRGFYVITSNKPLPFLIDEKTVFRTEYVGVYKFDIHD